MNGGGRIDRFSQFDSRAYPGSVILAAGDAKERRITRTYHPSMNVLLSRTEASLIGGLEETIFDYDASGDGTTPNQNPPRLRYQLIEKGTTRNRQGAAVAYRYMTSFTCNARGEVTPKDGPPPGTSDLVHFAYAATTGNLLTITFPSIGTMQLSEYDAAGFPGLKTDGNGGADRFTHDARGIEDPFEYQGGGWEGGQSVRYIPPHPDPLPRRGEGAGAGPSRR